MIDDVFTPPSTVVGNNLKFYQVVGKFIGLLPIIVTF